MTRKKQDKKITFGYGEVERQNIDIKTSTKHQRCLFFALISEMKPEVVESLFRLNSNLDNAPIYLYAHYLKTKHEEIESLVKDKQKELDAIWLEHNKRAETNPNLPILPRIATNIPERFMLRKVIPSWKDLQNETEAKQLCNSLKKWANNHNLLDDWELDFALNVLEKYQITSLQYKRDFDIFYRFELNPIKIWNAAVNQYRRESIPPEIEVSLLFNFEGINPAFTVTLWKEKKNNYEVDNALWSHPSELWRDTINVWGKSENGFVKIEGIWKLDSVSETTFRREAEAKFLSLLHQKLETDAAYFFNNLKELEDSISKFKKKIDNFINEALKEKESDPNFGKTPSKNTGNLHFRWLVDYQIPPTKSQSEIADSVDTSSNPKNVTANAVFLAITRTSEQINLTLREV